MGLDFFERSGPHVPHSDCTRVNPTDTLALIALAEIRSFVYIYIYIYVFVHRQRVPPGIQSKRGGSHVEAKVKKATNEKESWECRQPPFSLNADTSTTLSLSAIALFATCPSSIARHELSPPFFLNFYDYYGDGSASPFFFKFSS